jgi:hypothetical protein
MSDSLILVDGRTPGGTRLIIGLIPVVLALSLPVLSIPLPMDTGVSRIDGLPASNACRTTDVIPREGWVPKSASFVGAEFSGTAVRADSEVPMSPNLDGENKSMPNPDIRLRSGSLGLVEKRRSSSSLLWESWSPEVVADCAFSPTAFVARVGS